jgi:hypothetical protein
VRFRLFRHFGAEFASQPSSHGDAGDAATLLLQDLQDADLLVEEFSAEEEEEDERMEDMGSEEEGEGEGEGASYADEAEEEAADVHAAAAAAAQAVAQAGAEPPRAPGRAAVGGLDGLYGTAVAEEEETLAELALAAFAADADAAGASEAARAPAVRTALRQLHEEYERALRQRMIDEVRARVLRQQRRSIRCRDGFVPAACTFTQPRFAAS